MIGECAAAGFGDAGAVPAQPLAARAADDSLVQLSASGLAFRRGTPPDSVYIFKHALVQDVAYDGLLRGKRQQIHAAVARALEERFPETAEIEPEVLADPASYAAWEKHMVARCVDAELSPESVIATLARDARMVRVVQPVSSESISRAIVRLPARGIAADPPETLESSLAHLADVIASVPEEWRPEPDTRGRRESACHGQANSHIFFWCQHLLSIEAGRFVQACRIICLVLLLDQFRDRHIGVNSPRDNLCSAQVIALTQFVFISIGVILMVMHEIVILSHGLDR